MSKRVLQVLMIMVISCSLFFTAACSAEQKNGDGADKDGSKYNTIEELTEAHARVGVMTGSVYSGDMEAYIPGVETKQYNSISDLVEALNKGKIDAILDDDTDMRYISREVGGLRMFDEYVREIQYGYVFPKTHDGKKLRKEVNGFIDEIRKDGTLDRIEENWLGESGEGELNFEYEDLPDENGTIRFVTDPTLPPMTFVRDNRVVGYDVELIARFCKQKGYGLQIVQMSFDSILAAVKGEKCDIAGSGISITPERKDSVLFSEPYYEGGGAVVVKGGDNAYGGSFLSRIKDSFYKTFALENRYRLFLAGIGITLLIALLAIIIGSLLGFLLYLAGRRGSRVVGAVASVLVWIVKWMPMVVLLMIFYYVVFGEADISGVVVAVIVFSITFTGTAYSILRDSVSLIDRGQFEAAYALGYTDRQTFFKIILPQAAQHFMPVYKDAIVSLIKETAIVGYVAVMDLTKVGDIVRSNTYEAFFPLIAVAVIYFLIAVGIAFIVGRIQLHTLPLRRNKEEILKGVRTDDRTDPSQKSI
jgi:ABC-type amino acid transport system permease subunit